MRRMLGCMSKGGKEPGNKTDQLEADRSGTRELSLEQGLVLSNLLMFAAMLPA